MWRIWFMLLLAKNWLCFCAKIDLVFVLHKSRLDFYIYNTHIVLCSSLAAIDSIFVPRKNWFGFITHKNWLGFWGMHKNRFGFVTCKILILDFIYWMEKLFNFSILTKFGSRYPWAYGQNTIGDLVLQQVARNMHVILTWQVAIKLSKCLSGIVS